MAERTELQRIAIEDQLRSYDPGNVSVPIMTDPEPIIDIPDRHVLEIFIEGQRRGIPTPYALLDDEWFPPNPSCSPRVVADNYSEESFP